MTVIAINTQKGGVLKTTITTHLASVIALEGKSVLIVDTDSQSNAALTFNINPNSQEYSLYEVLEEDIPPEMAINNVFEKGKGKIDLLPSRNSLMMFTETPRPNNKFGVLKDRLGHLERYYDYILIDTPPSLGLMVGNVLAMATDVIIPFNPEHYSRRSLVNILDTIEDFRRTLNPKLNVLGIVATIVERQTSLHSDIIQATRQMCDQRGVKMYDNVIPKSIRYASAIGYEGKPLILTKPKHEMSKIYFDLWEEIKNEQRQTTN